MSSDPQVLAAQKELASRVLCKRRLIPFTQRINPRYDAGWVHHDIARRLERFSADVANGLSPRLMLMMPPRAGKSELASRMFPAWHLGRHPDHEIIACSYNVSLALSFSRKVKEAIQDPAYESVFPLRLNPNHQSAEEWGIEGTRGGYVAAGVGGGITGKGCSILVVDDPLKSAEEADSADIREKLFDWYGSTAYTRLAPGGGVLVIQCMTGDTPVMMADGAQRRLDTLVRGDKVATFSRGVLAASRVAGMRSNGRDSILELTTISGKIVRANGRHPFLAALNGELKWVRARSLTTAHTIAALKGSGGSGKGSLARQPGAANLQAAEGCALPTTPSRSGRMATGHPAPIPLPGGPLTSSTVTGSPPMPTKPCSPPKEAYAACARSPKGRGCRNTGGQTWPSTTATTPAGCAVCCATDATLESDILDLSPWHLPQPGTSDFTMEEIVSIVPAGEEEVFDLQVDTTENFIANGLVSHNTCWHDDDLAGRLQLAMADPEADQFEVVKYPAVAEQDEWIDTTTDEIVRIHVAGPEDLSRTQEDAAKEVSAQGHDLTTMRFLRCKGEALHPQRYDRVKLNRIKKTLQPRFWSALYQQNPVPDDGAYFLKEHFKRAPIPPIKRSNVYIAFDFAISERKQNDYTVGTVGLQDDNDVLHVAEVLRFKSGDALFIVDSILALCRRWYSSNLVLGFEDGQIYKTMAVLLKKRMQEEKFYPSIQVLVPVSDKMARARPLQGRMQQGMVSFNEQGEWFDVVRQEMLRFPAGVHDDCVDSLAWMTHLCMGRAAPRKIATKAAKSWKDKLSSLGRQPVGHMAA